MAVMPQAKPTRDFDLAVLGAGILGLATAYTWLLQHPESRLIVLEKEPAVATHQSGRNSGVLHSGIYYAPGSLKAQNCRVGKEWLEAFCREHGVPVRTSGKLIVARGAAELERLAELERRGIANGVTLERCTRERISEIEPAAAGVAGLFLPETGVVDFGAVCDALRRAILGAGGIIQCDATVSRIAVEEACTSDPAAGVSIDFHTAAGITTTRTAHRAIACAGLQADRIAQLAGLSQADLNLQIVPFRGEYQQLGEEAAARVRGLIYPVPDPRFPFLGVHFTRRICGRVDCGPNAVPALGRESYGKGTSSPRDLWQAATWPGTWKLLARHAPMALGEIWRSLSKAAFAKEASRLLPGLQPDDFSEAPAGIRAQALDRKGQLIDDYVIHRQGPLLHLLNAPSPAATSSLAIGAHLVRELARKP